MTQRFLAADIGATKTLIGIFHADRDSLVAGESLRIDNADHAGLAAMLDSFLARSPAAPVDAACIAFPGPVMNGRAVGTNIAWSADSAELSASLDTPHVRVVNDLEAAARGMLLLPDTAFVQLNVPAAPAATGNAAVLSVGTGLGEALLYWDGQGYRAIASEGSHADFAPQSDLEIALLRHMRGRLGGHVSWERVAAGPGLVEIYRFLRLDAAPEPHWLARDLASRDPAAAVSEAALQGRDPVCRDAVALFARLLGAEAGNLALKGLAVGGVYVCGGVPPQILPVLQGGAFMAGFVDKGRFAPLLREIPVKVALDVGAGLLGAARIAAEMAATGTPGGCGSGPGS
ncbi:MAG: glucokinase [Sneathiellaceae bacterium]